MVIELNGRELRDHASAHDYLKAQLDLPDYYGRNLDALYDLLTECGEPIQITLHHVEDMEQQLGPYAGALTEVLRAAADSNPNLTFIWD